MGVMVEMEWLASLNLRLARLAYEKVVAESGERVVRAMLRVRKPTSDWLWHVPCDELQQLIV